MYSLVEGNLFDYKNYYILAHACNCRGSWGSGVAKQFAQTFPEDYKVYKELCEREGNNLAGRIQLTESVLCLFTSRGYGRQKDSVEQILEYTEQALINLCELQTESIRIAAPTINAGLFAVPWEQTEELLKKYLSEKDNIEWLTVIFKRS